ncbi:MAG: membrane protein insertion efficiency factor YidD [Lacunisphaera sp.]|nr:membrane protein insertion efficiency factor YidD [Lacunisphaera sp.]
MSDHHTVAAVDDRRSSPTAVVDRGYSRILLSLPARAASGLVWVYQHTVSPALTAAFPTCGCRFAPTCSHYARETLREHGFLAGLTLTVIRLAKCGPWHPGGLDPVPPSRRRPVCARVHHA